MTLKTLLSGGLMALAITAPAHAAGLFNAGFETGDLVGWTYSDGYVDVVSETDDATADPIFGEHYVPTEGDWFARLTAGPDVGDYTLLSQAFTLAFDARVAFDAAFLAFDYLDFDDDAYVRVYSQITDEVVFVSSVAAVGDLGHTDWARFSTGLLAAGDYVFEAGVRNIDDGDPDYSSQLLIDNVAIAVPEPSTWAVMLLGFGVVGSILRRRRALA